MDDCHTGWRRDNVRVGRQLTLVLLKGIGFTRMSKEERIVSTLRTFLPGRWFVFLPEYRSQREPNQRREGRLGSEVARGPYWDDHLSCRGDAPVSPKEGVGAVY